MSASTPTTSTVSCEAESGDGNRSVALDATYQIDALCRVLATAAKWEDDDSQLPLVVAAIAPRLCDLNNMVMGFISGIQKGSIPEPAEEMELRLYGGLTPFQTA